MTLKEISYIVETWPVFLTRQLLGKLSADDKKRARKHAARIQVRRIIYKSQGHKVVGFIAEPKNGGGKLPCIIWNRGGDRFSAGIRPEFLFSRSVGRLASSGYIVIASQYSGNDGGEGLDYHGGSEIEDVLTLYKILKKYPRADANRVGMFGVSRGGMMCYLALARVKWIRAVVIQAGVADLFHQVQHRHELKKLYKKLFGGSKEEYKKRSVTYWIEKLCKKAPILLLHGTADWRVNVSDTLELGKRFYQEKIPYRMVIYEGEDHGISGDRESTLAETVHWFDRFVKNREQLPNLKLHED